MAYEAEKRYCRVPERVAVAISEVMSEPSIRKMEFEWKLFARWAEVAGDAVAEASTPVDIKNGVLYLRVNSSVWRNELHYMKSDLINRLNKEAGREIISNILFR